VGDALTRARTDDVERERVLAYRQARQHLSRRAARRAIVDVAAAGVQNTPPGSAALALRARVNRLTPDDVAGALERDRSLVQVYSLRGNPLVVPRADLGLFTRALLPSDEAALRHLLGPVLARLEADPVATFERTAAAVERALAGRTLTKLELHAELKKRVPESMRPWCPGCKSHHVSPSVLRAVALRGGYCFAERQGSEASFASTDDWLGEAPPPGDGDQARAELARRYLGILGPSRSRDFAAWAGIAPAEAERAWKLIEPELAPAGGALWILRRDAAALRSPPEPRGVRLLPPSDPYLSLRDRETLLPDRAHQKRVWRSIGSPGVVLVDGRLVATWRPDKRGARLRVSVQPLSGSPRGARAELEAEVDGMAAFRGCDSAETVVEG
jgi:Winged helix DNA-binding domain